MTKHGSLSDARVGVLILGADEARIGEWHPNRVHVLEALEREQREAAEHELVGPSYSHPRGSGEKATAARSSAQRDLYERRVEEHRERFARAAATAAARAARRLGWQLVLVLGDPRRAVPASEELARHGVEAVRSDLVLDWLRPAALASRLGPEIEGALAHAGAPRR